VIQTFLRLCLYLSFLHLKLEFRYSSLSFVILIWGRTIDKLAIHWQNFARVGLQLKFAFKIRSLVFNLVFSSLSLTTSKISPRKQLLSRPYRLVFSKPIPKLCFTYSWASYVSQVVMLLKY